MHIWLLCDDHYHPGEPAIAGLTKLADTGITVKITKDAGTFVPSEMNHFPVIVFSKSNNVSAANREKWLTSEVQQQLIDYVEAGGGLLVTHSGTASYKAEPLFTGLIGCAFITHPAQCPVTMTFLKKHPIAAGIEAPITETDEHYFIDVLDESADIFMTTTSGSGTQAGGYTLTRGKGRVCVLTPGHNESVWINGQYQKVLQNAIHWCARS